MATSEFGTAKSVFILTIVAGCFAILWPKIFYPMIAGTEPVKRPIDVSGGCCDVVYEKDVEVLRVLTEMCGRVNGASPGAALSPAGAASCRAAVLAACDFDIATFLNKVEQSKLGRRNHPLLDELRSFNTSVCLRRNFGVTPGSLGAPRRMRTWGATTSRHLRQERPSHLKPEAMHPALRERGRAIPASHIVPIVEKEPPVVSAARPPMPGMRPPMGGAGHVVPPPKTGGSTMGIVMPLYTIGIVLFFMYTIMKLFVRKTSEADDMKNFVPDPEFRRVVFADDYPDSQRSQRSIKKEPTPPLKSSTPDTTRLGWKERDTRDDEIDHLRRRLEETEKAMERIVAQMGKVPRVAATTLRRRHMPEAPETGPGDQCTKDESKAADEDSNQVTPTNKESLTEDEAPKHLSDLKKLPKTERTIEFLEDEKRREQEQDFAANKETKNFAELKKRPKSDKILEFLEDEKRREQEQGFAAPAVVVEAAEPNKHPNNERTSGFLEEEKRGEKGLAATEELKRPESPCVKVLGVETRARAEGGIEWHPPPSPVFGLPHSRPVTPLGEMLMEPHNIFLEGIFPSNSQLLVEDAATELLDDSQQDPVVILSGKMTLSLISVDAAAAVPTVPSDPASTLNDVHTAIIDDSSVDGDAEEADGKGETWVIHGDVDEQEDIAEEFTHYTTAHTAGNPSAANAVNSTSGHVDPEADDTAADVSAHDLLDDQEDLQDEYDAIWGAMELEEGEEEKANELLQPATGTQHHR